MGEIFLGKMAQPHDRFHPLERQFDLQARPEHLQHLGSVERVWQARPEQEVLGRFPNLGGHRRLPFGRRPLQFLADDPGGLLAAPDGDKSAFDPPSRWTLDAGAPLPTLSDLPRAPQCERFQELSPAIKQRERPSVQPHHHVPARLDHGLDSDRVGVCPVPNHDAARQRRNPPPCLTAGHAGQQRGALRENLRKAAFQACLGACLKTRSSVFAAATQSACASFGNLFRTDCPIGLCNGFIRPNENIRGIYFY
jgi:hypothetical protein